MNVFLLCFVWQELVEYYQSHSLKESFKLLDTTLRYPYKSRERGPASRASTRSPGEPIPGETPSSLFLFCLPIPQMHT